MERDPIEMALSTDVVMGIVLSYLSDEDLLSCRFVSKFWKKAASSVFRKRSTMMRIIKEEEKLMELEECMKQSSDFPFTGLTFDRPWLLNSDRAMEFFQNYGDSITRLGLDSNWEHKLHVLAPFIDHLPRLSILEIGRMNCWLPYTDFVGPVGQNNDKILKLPSVRTILISPFPRIDEDVLRQVVAAASPSLQIECHEASPEILGMLKNMGKLQAIRSIRFDSEDSVRNYKLKMDHLSLSESPSLTKLYFNTDGCLSLVGLMEVLLSSQHTLKDMHLEGIGLSEFSWEKFPVFGKLTTLNLVVNIEVDQAYLFRGRYGHKFPSLNELHLDVSYMEDENYQVIWSDGLFIVPSLRRLELHEYVSERGMKELAQAFPNVIEAGLEYLNYSDHFRPLRNRNIFDMWSIGEFQHLEKLKIWSFIVQPQAEDYINMDGFLTGIPLSICKNLHHQKQLMLDLLNCPFRESFSQVLRGSPNVLQLKNLKELMICVQPHHKFKEIPDDPPFISMVSVWYALQMLPNLRVKFLYNDHQLPDQPYLHKGDKEVLEAAFKHVQDHIKLEPVCYRSLADTCCLKN